jgi:hypothetical protein
LNRVCNTHLTYAEDFEDIKHEVLAKYPSTRGLSDEDRLKLIDKRQREIGRRIADKFSVVIDMEKRADKHYSIRPKANASQIIIDVDLNNFTVKTYMGDNLFPPVSLFNEQWAILPMYRWEESL